MRALRTSILFGLAAACAANPPPNAGSPTAVAARGGESAVAPPVGPPSTDADGDGIPAGDDKCPSDPENYNGTQDGDGCPDSVGAPATDISGRIYFDVGRPDIRSPAFLLLDVIAGAIKTDPDRYPTVALEGHAASNERGAMKLSLARASAVRLALIDRGVDPARLIARASGATVPRCRAAHEGCWERARRVEFAILPAGDHPHASTPAPATEASASAGEPERPEASAAAKPPTATAPLDQVVFAKGSAVLTPANLPTLDLLAGFLKANEVSMEIDGHAADNEKDAAKLAEARAAAVRAYLLACGVNAQVLVVRSHGATAPACKQKTHGCREQNRRVELRMP